MVQQMDFFENIHNVNYTSFSKYAKKSFLLFSLQGNVARPAKMDFTPLTPVSKIQINQQQQLQQPSERPLDRPTLVRPQRTSMVLIQNQNNGETSPSPSIQVLYFLRNVVDIT